MCISLSLSSVCVTAGLTPGVYVCVEDWGCVVFPDLLLQLSPENPTAHTPPAPRVNSTAQDICEYLQSTYTSHRVTHHCSRHTWVNVNIHITYSHTPLLKTFMSTYCQHTHHIQSHTTAQNMWVVYIHITYSHTLKLCEYSLPTQSYSQRLQGCPRHMWIL